MLKLLKAEQEEINPYNQVMPKVKKQKQGLIGMNSSKKFTMLSTNIIK